MHPTQIPNRARLLELVDQPNGIVQWAIETLAYYDAMRGALGPLTEIDAEHARLDWLEAPAGNTGASARQEAIRTLRLLPNGMRAVARYLGTDLDGLIDATWPGSKVTADQLVLVEELLADPTIARRQVCLLADVSAAWLESFAGPDDRNATNRQVRTLIAECHADGLNLDETRRVLEEQGHTVAYKRVWETFTRLDRKEVAS